MQNLTHEPIKNKYYKWYCIIITKAKNKIKPEGYVEKHHIIPKSLGGNNSTENLVHLTAREHYICHWLLTKCYVDDAQTKMIYAFHRLMNGNKNSKYYNIARKLYSKNMVGNKFGTNRKGIKHTDETKKKISQTLLLNPPNKGKKLSDSIKEKIRETSKKRKPTKETRKKLSESFMGEKNHQFGKKGILSPNFGKKHTNESKLLMSLKLKESWKKRKVKSHQDNLL